MKRVPAAKKYLHFLPFVFIIGGKESTTGPPEVKPGGPYIKACSAHLPLFNLMRGSNAVFREK